MSGPKIPIEEIARFPPPGMAAPVSFAFSHDDRLVTYLYGSDQSPVRQLHVMDVATGEQRVVLASLGGESEELSLEEALRRQRQRQLGQGITRYAWASNSDRILVPGQSAIYVLDGTESPVRKVVDADGPVLDPQLSPDGERVAYVCDAEVYVADVAGGEPRQLTTGARGTGKTHGLALLRMELEVPPEVLDATPDPDQDPLH